SDEEKARVSRQMKGNQYAKGQRKTPEQYAIIAKKISESHKKLGDKHWAKRPEVRAKMSLSRQGKPSPKKGIKSGVVAWNKGIKHIKVSDKNNHFWKGGITPVHFQIRHCVQYKNWRNQIFQRDNYTCQNCNKKGVVLNADHYPIPFSAILNKLIIEQGLDNLLEKAINYNLFWDISNGRTLCKKCHYKIGWNFWK
ncbi:MAG: hypothetical protein AABY22_25790, partial [Nanoarchaeota archaeon]